MKVLPGVPKCILKVYARLKIKTKMTLSFALIILLCSVFTLLIFFHYNTKIVSENAIRNFYEVLKQCSFNMDSLFLSAEAAIKGYQYNDTLMTIFNKVEECSLSEQLDDYKELSQIRFMNTANYHLSHIRFYFTTDAIYTREKTGFAKLEDIEEKPWYSRLTFMEGAPLWVLDENAEILCVREVRNYVATAEVLGAIEIAVKQENILSALESIITLAGGSAFLYDDQMTLAVKAGEYPGDPEVLLNADYRILNGMEYSRQQEVYAVKAKLSNNWTLLAALPLKTVDDKVYSLFLNIVLFSIAALALGFLLSFLLSWSLSSRIGRLIRFMEKADIYSDNYVDDKHYNDEITVIEKSFNAKLKTIRELVAENDEVHKKKAKADFDVLQEQINPHFLYNCIDSINWMAASLKAYDIARMSRLLGRFYRMVLNSGRQNVLLKDELEHVKVYLELMEMRMDLPLVVVYDIDETLLGREIIKLILQPVVENAIIHGLLIPREEPGRLLVRILKAQNESLMITVEDNGAGMDEATLERLRRTLSGEEEGGFGLRNVNQRIRLYYGNQYGVTLESTVGKGTRVTLTLPV